MANQAKCPFCDADTTKILGADWECFTRRTRWGMDRSETCYKRELVTKNARLERLEAVAEAAQGFQAVVNFKYNNTIEWHTSKDLGKALDALEAPDEKV
jgi:hypothetical protein